jgi:hypothetical protein
MYMDYIKGEEKERGDTANQYFKALQEERPENYLPVESKDISRSADAN